MGATSGPGAPAGAAKKPAFAPAPVSVISDTSLSAADLRALLAIALHDRMSDFRAAGNGCFARHATLAAECGMKPDAFARCLAKLKAAGYVRVVSSARDRRHKILTVPAHHYRPLVGEPANHLDGDLANDPGKIVGNPAGIVGNGECENGSFAGGSGGQENIEETTRSVEEMPRIGAPDRRAPDWRAIACEWMGDCQRPLPGLLAKIERAVRADQLSLSDRASLHQILEEEAAPYIDDNELRNHVERIIELLEDCDNPF